MILIKCQRLKKYIEDIEENWIKNKRSTNLYKWRLHAFGSGNNLGRRPPMGSGEKPP